LAKYGLGYAALSALDSRLIYCSITGFGQDGPYAERPGYDFVVQGLGGLMGLTGVPDGEPMRAGVAITDLMTGMYAVSGILAALLHRERTGRGQHIDVALLDVQVAAMANQALYYLVTEQNPGRHGNAHASIVPYEAFSTRNGDITVAAGNDGQFRRLCAVLGEPALAFDADYATNAGRVRRRDALVAHLGALMRDWDQAALLAALEAQGVPAGPINTLAQVFADPQVRHRQMAFTQTSAVFGEMQAVRCPLRLSDAEPGGGCAPPALGADTEAVLRDVLGLDPVQIAALRQARVVG
jgi:crotonobetainyl-CoA:carnitine CoA-transferase CaiB-like acyl-CoA transferase